MRGRNFMVEITKSVAAERSIKALDILQHNRSVRDQSKLDSDSRSINIAGAISAKLSGLPAAGNIEPLIVVDDLITTGATLAEGIRALRTAGFTVLGAVTGSVAKPLR
jgi:predicted amidophosphoribosyltransferase